MRSGEEGVKPPGRGRSLQTHFLQLIRLGHLLRKTSLTFLYSKLSETGQNELLGVSHKTTNRSLSNTGLSVTQCSCHHSVSLLSEHRSAMNGIDPQNVATIRDRPQRY